MNASKPPVTAAKKIESSIAERKEIAADLIFCRTILILVETTQRAHCFTPKRLAPGLCETLQDMAYQKLRQADMAPAPAVLESKRLSLALYAELLGALCHQGFEHVLAKIEPGIASPMQRSDGLTQKAKREVLYHVRLLRYMRFVPRQPHADAPECELRFLRLIHDVSEKSHGWRDLKHAVACSQCCIAFLTNPLSVPLEDN